jgi:CRP-like cAMP-binding protein
MTNGSRLEALRSLPELALFDSSAVRGLLSHVDEVEVGPGELLATGGRPCSEYLVVVEGSLEARSSAGLRRLGPGQSSGWRAMWERGVNPETLVTTSSARLLVMGRAQFRAVKALVAGREVDRPQVVGADLGTGADLDLIA